MSLTSTYTSKYTYSNHSIVNFYVDENEALSVTIDTKNLHMRTVVKDDCDSYVKLFGDPDVMGKFATGETKTKEETESRIEGVWMKRWRQNDPYNGLAVFEKSTSDFVGHVVLGHGDRAGESQLAYLFLKNHWGKGFGSEAVSAVVKNYAPATIDEGYTLEGETLDTIVATARPDNLASVRILEKQGMTKFAEEVKYNSMRYHFSIRI